MLKKKNAVEEKTPEVQEVQLTPNQRVEVNGIALLNLIGLAEQASHSTSWIQVQTMIEAVKKSISLVEPKK